MPIIVAGKLKIKPSSRDEFIAASRDSILQARNIQTCEDFAVSPDPLDSNRVNIYEKWASYSALEAFRDSGTDSNLFSLVESFEVEEYEINK